MKEQKERLITSFISNEGGQSINEDYFGFVEKDNIYCWVLADGLGGYGDGEVAAITAVEEIVSKFLEKPRCDESAIRLYIESANRAVYEKKHLEKSNSNMMSTIAVVIADKEKAVIGHVGDSRVYVFKKGKKIFCTKDHSVPYLLYETGEIKEEDIRGHEDSNRLTKALGLSNKIEASVSIVKLNGTEEIIMCSDGFWKMISEADLNKLAKIKIKKGREWLEKIETKYLRDINEKSDNYTACLIESEQQIKKNKINGFIVFYMWIAFVSAALFGAIIGSKILFIK